MFADTGQHAPTPASQRPAAQVAGLPRRAGRRPAPVEPDSRQAVRVCRRVHVVLRTLLVTDLLPVVANCELSAAQQWREVDAPDVAQRGSRRGAAGLAIA